jgi:hypothetical protein
MAEAIQRLLDEAAIRRVIDTYCHAVDRGTADDVAELFHVDGVLKIFDEVHKGRAMVRQWYADYHANFRSKLDMLRHKLANPLVDFEDADNARVACYLDADCCVRGSDEILYAVGRYEDRFVRDGESWRFGERKIIVERAHPTLMELLR